MEAAMTYYSVSSPRVADEGYGIRIINVRVVRDISFHYNVVNEIADKCNACAVDAEQFDDVLQNFLSDCESF